MRAEILQLPGVSGHGDMDELTRWITHLAPAPRHVFVNHGEDAVCERFAERLHDEFGLEASAPYSGTVYDLAAGAVVTEALPQPVKKTAPAQMASPVPSRCLKSSCWRPNASTTSCRAARAAPTATWSA